MMAVIVVVLPALECDAFGILLADFEGHDGQFISEPEIDAARTVTLATSALLFRHLRDVRRDPRIADPPPSVKSGRRGTDRVPVRSASTRLHSVRSSSLHIVSWCAPVLRHHPGSGPTMARRGRNVAAHCACCA